MSREEGERWVVDLVRDAKLDAKIDFKEVRSSLASRSRPVADAVYSQNTVQMNHSETPVYQSVIERSKGRLFRAQAMASAIEIRAGSFLLSLLENAAKVRVRSGRNRGPRVEGRGRTRAGSWRSRARRSGTWRTASGGRRGGECSCCC